MPHAKLQVAVHVFILKNKDVLLLKRKNTGFQDGKWSAPAGRLNSHELISKAAIRESNEEVGIKIKKNKLKNNLIMHFHDKRGERIYAFFTCEKWQGEPQNMEPEKCSDIRWFKLKNLPSMPAHVKVALRSILKGKTYIEYGFH